MADEPFVGLITETDVEGEVQWANCLRAIIDAARFLVSRDIKGAEAALDMAQFELDKLKEKTDG